MNRTPLHSWRLAMRRTAIVALVFSVIVAGVLLAGHLRIRTHHPLRSPEAARLQTRHDAETDPTVRSRLAGEIRAHDQHLRRHEQHHRRWIQHGTWMLAAAMALGLTGLRITQPVRPSRPGPSTAIDDPEGMSPAARTAVGALAAGLALIAAGTTFIGVTRLDGITDRSALLRETAPDTTSTGLDDVCPCLLAQPEASDAPPAAVPDLRPWPRFRGPAGLGIASHASIPTHWDGPSETNIRWKTPIPLPGKNSPIRWNRRLFLTGADAHRRAVFCYNTDDGELLWQRDVPGDNINPPVMTDTGYAAATMATDGRLVIAMFANGDLAAFDVAGHPRWQRALGTPVNPYGHAASLEIWQDRLLVQFDQGYSPDTGISQMLAIDTESGRTLWSAARPVQASWSTPAVFEMPDGTSQLLSVAAPYAIAYDPRNGRELWRLNCLRGDVAPSPVAAAGIVFVAQEYVTAAAIDPSVPRIQWEYGEGLPDIVSPLTDGERLYLVHTYGIVTCLDATDGRRMWEQDFETEFSASPVLAEGRVYLIDRDGVTHIFKNSDEYLPLHRCVLGERVETVPAFDDGALFIRGEHHLFAIGTPPDKPEP